MKAQGKGARLADLTQIRAALLERRRRADADAAAERDRGDAERRERSLFADAVGAVVPLRKGATPALPRERPPAVARQRQRDEAAALLESISDAVDKYLVQDFTAATIAEWARTNFEVNLDKEDIAGRHDFDFLEDYIKAQARNQVIEDLGVARADENSIAAHVIDRVVVHRHVHAGDVYTRAVAA